MWGVDACERDKRWLNASFKRGETREMSRPDRLKTRRSGPKLRHSLVGCSRHHRHHRHRFRQRCRHRRQTLLQSRLLHRHSSQPWVPLHRPLRRVPQRPHALSLQQAPGGVNSRRGRQADSGKWAREHTSTKAVSCTDSTKGGGMRHRGWHCMAQQSRANKGKARGRQLQQITSARFWRAASASL